MFYELLIALFISCGFAIIFELGGEKYRRFLKIARWFATFSLVAIILLLLLELYRFNTLLSKGLIDKVLENCYETKEILDVAIIRTDIRDYWAESIGNLGGLNCVREGLRYVCKPK